MTHFSAIHKNLNEQVFNYLGKEKLKDASSISKDKERKEVSLNGKDALLVRQNLFTWLIILFFYPRSIS